MKTHRPTLYDYENAKPRDYLVWSILTTALFGFVFGFIALHFSIKTNEDNNNGDLMRATTNSRIAYMFNLIGTIFGIVCYIIILSIILVYIARY
jgi:hypothetical protein